MEIEDSSCLSDCNCIQSLYIDYDNAGGVCAGSEAGVVVVGAIKKLIWD